jgi:hypothetical protein
MNWPVASLVVDRVRVLDTVLVKPVLDILGGNDGEVIDGVRLEWHLLKLKTVFASTQRA